MAWVIFWAFFFTKSSGHPGCKLLKRSSSGSMYGRKAKVRRKTKSALQKSFGLNFHTGIRKYLPRERKTGFAAEKDMNLIMRSILHTYILYMYLCTYVQYYICAYISQNVQVAFRSGRRLRPRNRRSWV
jgi:hypothetical protein